MWRLCEHVYLLMSHTEAVRGTSTVGTDLWRHFQMQSEQREANKEMKRLGVFQQNVSHLKSYKRRFVLEDMNRDLCLRQANRNKSPP